MLSLVTVFAYEKWYKSTVLTLENTAYLFQNTLFYTKIIPECGPVLNLTFHDEPRR